MQTRVAILCEDDRVWGLTTWDQTLPVLHRQGLNVCGLWLCPSRLSTLRSSDVGRWYLRTFGSYTFAKLALFAVVTELTRLAGVCVGRNSFSYQALSRRHGVPFHECASPNDPVFLQWLASNSIDVLVIMAGHILKAPVLQLPRLGTINKHAAMLPANRGLFPYFWATINRTPHGVSFHTVCLGVDEGDILVQEPVAGDPIRSMIRFYGHVFTRYPDMLSLAIRILVDGRRTPQMIDHGSYYGLPTRADVATFTRAGGVVITLSDILRRFRQVWVSRQIASASGRVGPLEQR